MNFITLTRHFAGWRFVIIVLLLIQQNVSAQSVPVYANTISSQDNVDNAANAVDNNLTTRARIRANSGLIAGLGAYSGELELQFPSILPANMTSFVKIQTDDEILPSLLGGSLGNLLSGVLGTVLIGNQEITVQARNVTTPVLTGESQTSGDFATPRLRIVVNAAGEYFVAVTPAQAYDRIRLTNRLGSLIGLNNTKRLDVYGAFYIGTPDICGGASFTSFDGSGLTLDLIGLGGAGVTNPNYVLDSNPNNFSRLSLGVLGVAASIDQTVYFDGTSQPTDQFFVRMRIDPALLAVGVANNVQIIASNGPNVIQTVNLSSLLNVDLLTLLQGNNIVSIPFSPGSAVNRLTVRYNSLLNVQLTQSLDLYGITRAPANPTITDPFTQNPTICSGSTASLVAQTVAGTQLNWYSSATGGTALATTTSGQPFVTPVLTANTSYYVSAKRIGCPEESSRLRIRISVIDLPNASNITIASPVSACNGSIVLSPVSSIGGATFRYYKDQNKTVEVTTGFSGDAGVTYVKDNTTGALSITGLNAVNSPYTYYVSLTVGGLCENSATTLKAVTVNYSSSLNLNVLSTISGCGSVNLKEAIVNFDNSPDIQYNFFNSANQPITAAAAANIASSGTYFIQETSLNGSCSSTVQQVNVTVNPNPTLSITNSNLVVNLGSSVTLNATSDSAVTWYDSNGNALASNTFGPFSATGFYTFTAIANNGNCSATGNVTVVVIDPANCPALTERVYADTQSWSSILTGGVSDASSAVDHNPQTFSTVTTGIGLLGIGTTWQTLQWNQTIAAGTPVTVKLGSQYSGLMVAGAYSVIGTKRNSSGVPVDIGIAQPVSGSLVGLLAGENSFEFIFVPSNFSGPKAYDGIRIIVGSVASVAQNVKVYEAYYNKQVSQVACSGNDVEDIFSGAVDLGIGAATATVGVSDEWNAVDADVNSFATLYSGAGVMAAADLTVAFSTPTLTTDRLEMIVSRPSTVLDLGLLAGFTVQLYRGNTAVSPVIDVNSSLLSLTLLGGGASARLTIQSQTVVYDRIKIRFGGVASVLDQLRIHDIRRRANTSIIDADPGNAITTCPGQTISLTVPADDCTTYVWYDTAVGGNVVSTGSSYTIPANLAAGVYTYYIQPVRFGCEALERGAVTVTVGQTAPPTAITNVTLNGGNATTFCNETNITLSAVLNSTMTITNPVFHWYDNSGAAISGQTASALLLSGLAPGTYTYSVGVSSGEYCETTQSDRAQVTFTILPFSQPADINANDTLICQGTNAVVLPTSTLPNPQFTWYFTNDNTQPIANGSTVNGITFTIATNGQLTLSGLTLANSPFTYYVGLTSDASCLNQNGNFKAVTITVNDSGTPTTNDETQDFCQANNPTVADIQVNEPNVVWYDSPAGTLLPDATPLVNGTTYYAGFAPSTGCGSAVKLAVTVTVNDAPTPTTNNATQNFCVINNPTVADIQVNETGITWFSTSIGGPALAANTPLANGTTYYGSLNSSGCESSVRLGIAVNINDGVTPTTNSATQSFCLVNNPTVADIQVNETGVIWYDAATNGNVVAPTSGLTNGATYYAAIVDTDNGCESSVRLAVSIIINDPAIPTTDNSTQIFCVIENPTVANIQVNESNVVWYPSATGGTALASTDALVNGSVYYAALSDSVTGCESSIRLAITVNVNNAPTPTTNDNPQEFCQANNPTIADIQVNETGIIWYNAATGGTALASTDALIDDTTYYASQIVNGCESSVRLAVSVNINDAPTPTTNNSTQNFCLVNNPTVADIQANETGVIWYDAATGGNVIPSATSLTNATTYYAALTNNGCDSSVRLAVNVNVNDPATPTTNNATQDFCLINNPTIANIQVNETNIVWYASAAGGTALASTDALVNGSVYYAALSDSATGCESSVRLAVTANVGDAPTPTTNDNTQQFCQSSNPTVANIQVNETGVIWYSAPTGGNLFAPTEVLVDGAVYYAAQIVNGCESAVRLAVTITIIDGGTPTTNDNTQDFCLIDNPTVANLQVNESNVVFYDSAVGGNQLSATAVLANGAIYYASFDSSTSCASSVRLAITATVNDPGTPTTADATQEFCQSVNPTIASIQVNETGVIWYSSATGGTALVSTTALIAGTYYAALVDGSGCESAVRLAVIISLTGNVNATITGEIQPCAFNQVTYTTEAGMSTYVWTITGGTIVSGGTSADNSITVTWPTLGVGIVAVAYTNACNGISVGTANINVITCSDLKITKTVDNPNPSVGDQVTFTVTVTNDGPGEIHDVVVTDVLPNGYNFIGISAIEGTFNAGTWLIPMLMPNQVAVMTMAATVLGTGNYVNTASVVMSNPVDTDLTNNTAHASVEPICLVVYNEFSPNNDGANDLFRIDCIENFPNNKLEVYNRYGSLVYSKSHYMNDWDGTANVSGVVNKDDKLPAGTYYYVLDIGAEGTKTGWLAITR